MCQWGKPWATNGLGVLCEGGGGGCSWKKKAIWLELRMDGSCSVFEMRLEIGHGILSMLSILGLYL